METRIGGVLEVGRPRTFEHFAGIFSAASERLQAIVSKTMVVAMDAANLVGVFFTPAAVVALVFAVWRLGVDLGWTEQFVIARGLFSHWQMWLVLALALRLAGSFLTRSQVRLEEESHE
jgi:hypothetical protein